MDSVDYLDQSLINGLDLYCYCFNNSINYIDYYGTDAIYVSLYGNAGGLPIVGHACLYYQDSDGNWWYTEYTGKFPFPWTAKVTDKRIGMHTEKLLKYLNELDCKYILLKGDFSSIKEFTSSYVNTNYGGYSLLTNSCLHYVRDVLRYTKKISDNNTIIPSKYKPSVLQPVNAGLSTSLDSSYTGGALQAFCMDILLPLNNIYGRNRRLIY